jgi:hypothetical protein
MTRGRSQKRHQSSRKSTDEHDNSQIRQGEEIATPPAQHMSPRRGRPEDFTEMNPSNTGHGRQNPSVNFKKKAESEEEDKEEEDRDDDDDDEEEEEIAIALDSKKFPMCILGLMHEIIPNKN